MPASHWDSQAEAYDELIGQQGDPLRRDFLDPIMLNLLGNLEGKRVLDAGCGNGYFSDRAEGLGARVLGVDSSAELLKIAKSKFRGDFQVADLTQKLPLPDASFDLVLAHLVLMDLPECATLMAESYRVLNSGGRVIVSILHPLFTPPVGKFHRGILGRIWPRLGGFLIRDYFTTRRVEKLIYGTKVKSIYYHRTFASYINTFLEQGFSLRKMLEPRPSREFLTLYPQYKHAEKVPIFLVLEFQKN
ncbi:MAG: class I SAM-dependent methyltransferase [Candidatus Gracilibacteria bacterium]|nr:class I SAM-dependent methyltransferase [Candidatus Gracilibacteria bacterium]